MRIPDSVVQALNEQVKLELGASNSYLAMAVWLEVEGYEGSASYYYAQSDEERTHMLKIIQYMTAAGCTGKVPSAGEPQDSFESLEAVIRASLGNEQKVTEAIYRLVSITEEENDRATRTFLEWFITEQMQEEAKFESILQKFDTIGRDKIAIHEIDKIMASLAAQPQNA